MSRAGAGMLVAAALAIGAAVPAKVTARPRAAAHASGPGTGHFARRVRISGGRRLYMECRGRGTPTVMLEAGAGDSARVWQAHDPGRPAILPAVAKFTRVCTYDRPGTYWSAGLGQPRSVSRSDPVTMPRTVRDVEGDLNALLAAARRLPATGIRGAVVLVGHSFGGWDVRLEATTHPSSVAGLVSIDAQSEWFADAYKRLLTRDQYTSAFVYPPPVPGFAHSSVERLNLDASAAEVRQQQADTPLRRMPFVVLSHNPVDQNPFGFPSDWPIAALNQAFNTSQAKLVALLPGTRHVVAHSSQHYIQIDQPRLVIGAIRSVVDRVRRSPAAAGSSDGPCRNRTCNLGIKRRLFAGYLP